MTESHRYAQHRRAALVAACSLLAACAAPPALRPARWPAGAPDARLEDVPGVGPRAGSPATGAAAQSGGAFAAWPQEQWWRSWQIPELEALITQARRQAPTIALAQARIRTAQAALARTEAGQGLQAGVSTEVSRTRYSEVGTAPAALAGRHAWSNAARLNLSWDLDWSGRQRAAVEAAFSSLQAVHAEAEAAQVILDTEIALAWFELARLQALIDWTDRLLSLQDKQRGLLAQRIAAGLDRSDLLEPLSAAQARTRAERMEHERQLGRVRRAITELCSMTPQEGMTLTARWPDRAPPAPATELPASLLARRADLVAHRWRIESAEGAVRQAHAAHFPEVNLAAFAGLISLGLDRWISLGARSYGAGPVLSLPLFDAGARAAQQSEREAMRDALIAEYHAALLRAVREVAQELEGLRDLQGQAPVLKDVLGATEKGLQAARLRQAAGMGTALPVLEAEQQMLLAQRPMIELQARQWMGRVSLVRALGGGFDDERSNLPLRVGLRETP